MQKAKTSVINNWAKIKLYCGKHEDPVLMTLVANDEKYKEPYYQCTCEGCEHNNYFHRVPVADFERINNAIEKELKDADVICDLTGFRFTISRHEPMSKLNLTIAKYTPHSIHVVVM